MQDDTLIALIEDDADLTTMVAAYLEREGFRVTRAAHGRAAMALLETQPVDLMALDLGLPGGSGFDVLQVIRQGRHRDLPVIIVTGRGEETDRIVGLELGADDYLVKPFSPRELSARIRAVLLRVRPRPDLSIVRLGGLLVDTAAHEARTCERPTALSPQEYALLEFLATAPGRTFSRDQLLDRVRGSSPQWQGSSTVDEHVHRIRRKLTAAGVSTPRIVTVRGSGYRLDS
jgi:two-component system response regulator ResD